MTSVWIIGDQLLDPHPALARARADGECVEVVMVESARRRRRLPCLQEEVGAAAERNAPSCRGPPTCRIPRGLVATTPYVASAAYIDRMSDYCGECLYDRGRRTGHEAGPFNTLYWNFLLTHERRLRANPRLGPAVLGLRRFGAAERRAVRASAEGLLARLDRA